MVVKNKEKIFKMHLSNKMVNYYSGLCIDKKLYSIVLKFIKLIKRIGALENNYKNNGAAGDCEIIAFKNKINK